MVVNTLNQSAIYTPSPPTPTPTLDHHVQFGFMRTSVPCRLAYHIMPNFIQNYSTNNSTRVYHNICAWTNDWAGFLLLVITDLIDSLSLSFKAFKLFKLQHLNKWKIHDWKSNNWPLPSRRPKSFHKVYNIQNNDIQQGSSHKGPIQSTF